MFSEEIFNETGHSKSLDILKHESPIFRFHGECPKVLFCIILQHLKSTSETIEANFWLKEDKSQTIITRFQHMQLILRCQNIQNQQQNPTDGWWHRSKNMRNGCQAKLLRDRNLVRPSEFYSCLPA